MKQLFSASVLIGATLVAGCISPQRGLVLEPIGPPNVQLARPGSNGTLVVFSAFDPHADFNDLPYLRHYTDYKISSADGTLQQTVHNNNGQLVEGPKSLELPVGSYRVVAHANGYGLVTVPVVIQSNQVTIVHLEGSASWPNNAALLGSNPVRLPNGEIAGWRANTEDPTKP
jgi:virulence-associated protein VagC